MLAVDAAFGVTATLVWATVAYKVARLRPATGSTGSPASGRRARHDLASYALVCCLSAGAAAVTLQISVVGGPIDRIAGINITQLVAATLVIAGTCAFQIFVVCVNDPQPSARRRARPRLLTAAVAIAVTATTFILAPATRPGEVPALADPFAAAHVVAYAAYMGIGAIDVSRLAMRFARLGDRSLLRLGLYMVSGGAYIVGLFAAVKIVFVGLFAVAGPDLIHAERAITYPLVVAGAMLTSIGSTIPSWGRWVGAERLANWLGIYMSHLTLYPLWRALVAATATVPLDQRSRWADRLMPTDIRFRLTRRIIEIRDGLVSLRPYRNPITRRVADELATRRGLTGIDLAATVEAADIARALNAFAVGQEARHEPARDTGSDAGTVDIAASIADEVSWLSRVTDALEHSPIVATVSPLRHQARSRSGAAEPVVRRQDMTDRDTTPSALGRETP